MPRMDDALSGVTRIGMDTMSVIYPSPPCVSQAQRPCPPFGYNQNSKINFCGLSAASHAP